MRSLIEKSITISIQKFCLQNNLKNIWEYPIVKFADAKDPLFDDLKNIVIGNHYLPKDYIKNATIVISYFLPFKKEIGQNNISNYLCSSEWAKAYLDTNKIADFINKNLIVQLKSEKIEACLPFDNGMVSKKIPMSRWSQRHVAYIAGHGTFGLNNMLISDRGCVGRYYSIITKLDLKPDPIVKRERCIYKANGGCKKCVKKCRVNALSLNEFDRFKCLNMCLENDSVYIGADVCGKCTVGLPCSYKVPI